VKLLSDYLSVCNHNPPTLQTDGETDGRTSWGRLPQTAGSLGLNGSGTAVAVPPEDCRSKLVTIKLRHVRLLTAMAET